MQPPSTCNLKSGKRLHTPHTKTANRPSSLMQVQSEVREAESRMRSSLSRSSSAGGLPLKPTQAFPPIRLPYGEGAGLDVLASPSSTTGTLLSSMWHRVRALLDSDRNPGFGRSQSPCASSLNSFPPSGKVRSISSGHAMSDGTLDYLDAGDTRLHGSLVLAQASL